MIEVANQELKQVGPYVETPFDNQSRHNAANCLSHVILRVMKRYKQPCFDVLDGIIGKIGKILLNLDFECEPGDMSDCALHISWHTHN
jgi:hypothetical protein